MTQMRDRSRLAPLLGGVALAMLVLATMIGSVQAETICERCVINVWNRATVGECANMGQWTMECLNKAVKRECWNTHICPSDEEAPSTVECAGSDLGCPNNAVGICNNETWYVNCEAGTSKKCLDTQVPPDGNIYPSHCYVTCSCRE